MEGKVERLRCHTLDNLFQENRVLNILDLILTL